MRTFKMYNRDKMSTINVIQALIPINQSEIYLN